MAYKIFFHNKTLLLSEKHRLKYVGAFCFAERGNTMAEREEKTIYCPKCNRKAFTIYVGAGMVMKHKCSKCNQLVVYNPRYGVKLKPLEERNTSSGVRFY